MPRPGNGRISSRAPNLPSSSPMICEPIVKTKVLTSVVRKMSLLQDLDEVRQADKLIALDCKIV